MRLHKAQQRPSFIFLEPDIRAYIPAVEQVTPCRIKQ